MKDKSNLFIAVLILLVISVVSGYYLFYWDINKIIHPDRSVDNIETLVEYINADIDSGKESGTFYISRISEDAIVKINDNICNINGNVSQYSIVQSGRQLMRIVFLYDISDNYYAYEKYKHNIEIPEDNTTANRLYNEVKRVLENHTTDDMSDYEKELAIHDFIVANCEYGFLEGDEQYGYKAYGALVQHHAVCNGYAEAFALLLKCADIENKIVIGTADDELHAWNLVKLDDEWYQNDITWDDPNPDRGTFVGHAYFNVTDDIMDNRHVWDEEKYEQCTADKYNYYKQNDLICTYVQFVRKVEELSKRDSTGSIELVLLDYDEDNYNMYFFVDSKTIYNIEYSLDDYGNYKVIAIFINQKN